MNIFSGLGLVHAALAFALFGKFILIFDKKSLTFNICRSKITATGTGLKEGIKMAKEKRVFNPVPLVVVLLALMVAFIFVYGIHSIISFHVHTNLSPKTKAEMASFAKRPGISDYIERYGDRGPMDIDYQIETCTFPSLAALGNSINYVEPVSEELAKELGLSPSVSNQSAATVTGIEKAVSQTTPRTGTDLKGKKAKIYQIGYYCPASAPGYVSDGSYNQEDYWEWTYSVYEYPDGTYRFVVNVQTS